jgi:hypothetical protein
MKNFGDTLVKYHEIPILDDRNINNQGIDANGVTMTSGKWYGWDATGARIEYNTKADAKEALRTGAVTRIQSGDGNMFGSSKDVATQRGAFPLLTEEGGMVKKSTLALAA